NDCLDIRRQHEALTNKVVRGALNLSEVILAAGIAFGDRSPGIAGAFTLFSRQRKWIEAPSQSTEVMQITQLRQSNVPARVCPQRHRGFQKPNAGPVIAVRIHLRDQNAKRRAKNRWLI